MPNEIVFTSAVINRGETNRHLEQDENGYYTITLGALNAFNSAGAYYVLDGAEKLFKNSSILMRRIKNGYLRAESGHPKRTPGMSMSDYMRRILTLDERNFCAHIKEVKLVHTDVRESGAPANKVLIVGKVKPEGPNAQALKDNLDNPDANCAFSIRSLTNDKLVGGVLVKTITNIVGWDFVTEPGMSDASKWKTLGIESIDLLHIDLSVPSIKNEITTALKEDIEVSNENDKEMLSDILHNVDMCTGKASVLCNW